MYKYLLILAVILCPVIANAYTASFEEINPGDSMNYYFWTSGFISIGSGFDVVDHSTSAWGIPHSPNNVLANNMTGTTMIILHGISEPGALDPPPAYASYFGAYFSTAPTTVVNMTIHRHNDTPVAIAIGDIHESWTNRYIDFASPEGSISSISFSVCYYPIGTSSFFSMDDLTFTPVSEPSSILALLTGIAGIGGFALRRRG